jgi:hypothetical protein
MANIEPRNVGGPIQYVVTASGQLASIVNPKVGEFALALADGTLWFHDGAVWTATAGGGGGGSGISVDTAGNVVG